MTTKFLERKDWLFYNFSCAFLYFLCLGIFTPAQALAKPPVSIPSKYLSRFNLESKIPIVYSYRDDSYSSSKPRFYSKKDIEDNITKVKKRVVNYYGKTDTWLYEALKKYPIKDKEVAIIGSVIPWYESIVIAFGGRPTTIEYNAISTDDSRLNVLTADQLKKHPKKFDVILSISSIEHDGLGRYGDPINPDGDLEFMSKARNELLKDSGYLILAMPVGRDQLVWNLHRVYGKKRLNLLLKDWKIIDSFGFDENMLEKPFREQPVFYLSPNLTD